MEAKLRQLDSGAEEILLFDSKGASGPSPSSKFVSLMELPTIGTAALWVSVDCSTPWLCESDPICRCDIERTTSPLHIGQVRRRVVNHGVLESRLAG
jgi:hypothetical protein